MIRRALMALLLGLSLAAPAARAEDTLLHGADSIFATPDVVIVWGVLRESSDPDVVIRVAPGPRFGAITVEAVDPFANTRRPVIAIRPLAGPVDITRRRADFTELPRLEIRLSPAAGAEGATVTVYYLGVPDTTPEFTSQSTLRQYLNDAVARSRR